jgi:hypothetical protein
LSEGDELQVVIYDVRMYLLFTIAEALEVIAKNVVAC